MFLHSLLCRPGWFLDMSVLGLWVGLWLLLLLDGSQPQSGPRKDQDPEDSLVGDNHVHEPARESPAYSEPGNENHSEEHEQKR